MSERGFDLDDRVADGDGTRLTPAEHLGARATVAPDPNGGLPVLDSEAVLVVASHNYLGLATGLYRNGGGGVRAGDVADRVHVQTGALADTRDMCEGNPPYDPAAIDVPTMIVRGSKDASSIRQDALTLYDALAVPDNRSEYTELRGGTHFAMHGPRRHDLYSVVSDFQDRV